LDCKQHYLLALFEGDLKDVLARWELIGVKQNGRSSAYFRLVSA